MSLRGVGNQFVETFRKLSVLQRVSLLAATVAVFVVVIVLVAWANKPVYKELYVDMQEQDVKDVTASLEGKNIPYKVNDGKDGKTISITGEDVYATRISLSLEGLPKDMGTGFELFDTSKFGMTGFEQSVQYQRALQGELARSISALNEIIEAKVHLTMPKENVFVKEDDESKASVVVRLQQGATLRPDQVKAISRLVAASVKGLRPETVQILDTAGNLLSDFVNEEQEALYATQSQIEQQKKMEKDLEKKLQGMLATTIGADKYVAKVSVELDFSKKKIMSEMYADTPVLRSSRNIEINAKSTGKGPEGIPGVESNLAEPDLLIDGIMSEYSKTDEIQNFEISKTITEEEKKSGEVKRLTVSVVVDDKPEQVEQDGVRNIVKRPRTDDELQKIRTAVASAVGYNVNRGDIVDVTNISFDTSAEWDDVQVEEKKKIMEWVGMAAKYASAVLILLLFYLLLIRPIMKKLENAKELDEEMLGSSAIDAQLSSLDITIGDESGFPKTIEDLEREIESELDESVSVNVEAVKSKVMLKKIEEASHDDPEMVANLVKAMIKGG